MTEAELLDAVTRKCNLWDLWWFHAYDSRRTVRGQDPSERVKAGAGWVDLVIVGRHGALFVELKSEHERRSMAQVRWADRIVKAGLQYRLWRPEDLADDTISKALQEIR